MGEFKFLNSNFIDHLLRGEMLFRRLLYYRLLEVVTQDQWIGDVSEGVAHTTIDHVLLSPETPNNTEMRRKLEEARGAVKISDNATGEITDMTIVTEVDCFVFCFSTGDLKQLTDTMCSPDRPEYAYDGCVSIFDPIKLVQAICDNGTYDGQPVKDNFEVRVGPVDYCELITQDFATAGVQPANPFKKDIKYAAQQEMRIVLIPKNRIESDSVFIGVNSPDIHFREEFRFRLIDMKVSSCTSVDKRSTSELFDALVDATRLWRRSSMPAGALWACRDRDERQALMDRDNAERSAAFDSHWIDIVRAYWRLRPTHPDRGLDLAITLSVKGFHLHSLLRNYLHYLGYDV